MASRQMNMAALNAEIVSRKRNLSTIKKEADDPNQPKITKLSKLHLKTDKRRRNANDDDKVYFHLLGNWKKWRVNVVQGRGFE